MSEIQHPVVGPALANCTAVSSKQQAVGTEFPVSCVLPVAYCPDSQS
jgi:hypothetical protein